MWPWIEDTGLRREQITRAAIEIVEVLRLLKAPRPSKLEISREDKLLWGECANKQTLIG